MSCKHIAVFIAFLLFLQIAYSQSKRTVVGEYRMMVPSYMSREEARLTAIEQAKTEALAKEFGTIVSQTNLMLMEESNRRSNDSFYSIGQCDVKGVWLKTEGEPIVTEQIIDGKHWLEAKVKGVARELRSATVDIENHLLRNGKGDEFESDEYRDGDRFYVSFQSPRNGYLAVYLLDAKRDAYLIVPNKNEELFPVKRGDRYVFIDDEKERFILTTEEPMEINQVYIIFSPNKFFSKNVSATNDGVDLGKYRTDEFKRITRPPYIPCKKFQEWINKLRVKDTEMQVITKLITIKGQE